MNPILYAKNETSFTSNGLGVLSDTISCKITEERNGKYELTMTYPVTGIHYDEISHSCVLKANEQLFRIYSIEKPINGIVTIDAEHISYQLAYIPVAPCSADGAASALQALKSNALASCPFDFWSDVSTAGNYKLEVPSTIRAQLGGTDGSVLETFGGEYEFDNYTVKLHQNRGADRGVTIRYGKNLTDLKQEENIESTYTSIVGFYKDDDTMVRTNRIDSASTSNYPYPRVQVVDFSSDFDEPPTVTQLTTYATNYMNANGFGAPKINLTIKFVQLWQSKEYEQLAALERVYLCDTVGVYFEKLGVSVKAKVIKTVYDVLLERYDSVTLGNAKSNMSNRSAGQAMAIASRVTGNALTKAVNHATSLITGEKGGYVVFHTNADGKPYEILIMDTDDINTATNVWRWNQSGWGHSSTGYSGPYTLAATLDGGLNADFITAGVITGIQINNGNGTFQVSSGGTVTASNVNITGGSLDIGSGKFHVANNGDTVAKNLTLLNVYSAGNASFYATDTANGGIYSNANIYALKNITAHNDITADGDLLVKINATVQGNLYSYGYPSFGSATYQHPYRMDFDTASGYLRPYDGGTYSPSLGSQQYAWRAIYSKSAVVVVSDRNKKHDIKEISEKYLDFFELLKPVTFKMNDGDSGRDHVGFIAQDIEEALEESDLSPMEFAGFCKETKKEAVYDEDGNCEYIERDGYNYSLRYEEFIALNTLMIQNLMQEVKSLKAEIRELKGAEA